MDVLVMLVGAPLVVNYIAFSTLAVIGCTTAPVFLNLLLACRSSCASRRASASR